MTGLTFIGSSYGVTITGNCLRRKDCTDLWVIL